MHFRKTWNELRKEIAPSSFPLLGAEAAQNQCKCSYERIACPSIVFPWGYLRLKGDPGPWINRHYDSHSLVRFLDLDLSCDTDQISESIGELAELNRLYLYNSSYLKYLPNKITMLQKLELLSVQHCDVELPPDLNQLVTLRHLSPVVNGVESITYGLEKLSNLETLNLRGSFDSLTELPLDFVHFDKCFRLESLPSNLNDSVRIFVDNTDDTYYENLGYYDCLTSAKASTEGN